MKKFLTFLCAVTLVLGLVGSASAVPWTWTDTYNPEDIYFSAPSKNGVQSWNFQHDITDDGFDVGDDLVWNYDITLSFYDDSQGRREPGDRPYEFVSINLPGSITDRYWIEIDITDVELGASFWGLVELNSSGLLDVTLTRERGDFFFAESTLNAHGCETAPVPEPSTILLMGIGLLGLVGYSRKRSKKS